jgi:hypothetical protein
MHQDSITSSTTSLAHSRFSDLSENTSQPQELKDPFKFVPHEMQIQYPKHIQKHLNRKSLNMERLMQTIRTPSKHSCGKEIKRMSELAKVQESEYYKLQGQSSNRKKKLSEEGREVQSALSNKGIDIESTECDISKVFSLPFRHKTQKQEEIQSTVSPSQEFTGKLEKVSNQELKFELVGGNNFLEEDKTEIKFQLGEVADFSCGDGFARIPSSESLIFKDIHNLPYSNDDFFKNTPLYKPRFPEKNPGEDKENDLFKLDDENDFSMGHCPSFARVFHDEPYS